jgi:CubicO group peptidase (beta-lactamase class C family)
VTSSLDAETVGRVESFVSDWVTEASVPGAALALVDRDGQVYADGFGARDLASNAPATPRTLFGIGSCTKSFTAFAVLELADEGALDLSDPVAEYVDLAGTYPGEPVTIAEFLSHTSGVPSDGLAGVLIPRLAGLDAPTVPASGDADFARHVRAGARDRVTRTERSSGDGDGDGDDDGDGGGGAVADADADAAVDVDSDATASLDRPFLYYNSGYTLLGEVLEAVTGRSYAAVVRDRLLAPLGMSRSTFDRETFEARSDRATFYALAGDAEGGGEGERTPEPAGFPFDDRVRAAGGLVSSVEELSTYLRCQLNEGRVDGETVVPPERVARAHEPRAVRREFLDGTPERYGYGWMSRAFLDDTLVGHGGSVGVSTAYVGFLAEAGLGVALLCNAGADPHPQEVGPAVLALARGADETAVPRYALRAQYDGLDGDYRAPRGTAEASVAVAGGTLALALSTPMGDRELSLVPESLAPDADPARFHAVAASGERLRVRFERHEDGPHLFVQRWRLRPAG